MAIIGVKGARAPRVVKEEKEQKKDPFDVILKGLGIAQSVFGIKSATEQSELNKLKIAQAERLGARQQQLAETESISPEQFAKTSIEISDPEAFKKEFGAVPIRQVSVLGPKGEAREVTAVDKDAFKLFTEAKRKDKELAQKQMLAGTKKEKRDPAKAFEAAGFADRVQEANEVLGGLELAGFDRSGFSTALKANILGPLGEFGEFFKGTELKQFEQAQRNFINSILRRESGAAIAASEFDSAEKQYFPVAGDSPKVVEQKRRNRIIALNNLRREAAGDIDIAPQFSRGPRREMAAEEFTLPGESQAFADESEEEFLKNYIIRNQPTPPQPRRAPVQFGDVPQPPGTPSFGGSL